MTESALIKHPHLTNGEFYDPQTEYYHLTYEVISSLKWVRSCFLKLSEVKDQLEELPLLLTPGMVPSNDSKLSGIIADFHNLKLYNESWLSELHKDWNEETKMYTDSEFTNRQVIFDNRYEQYAVSFTGVPSLSLQKGEERGAWRERVENHRSALKNEEIARRKLHGELADHQGDLPALFALKIQ
jgi:hypothetical protein